MFTINIIDTKPRMFIHDAQWRDSVTRFHYDLRSHALDITQAQMSDLPEFSTIINEYGDYDSGHKLYGITVYSTAHNDPEDIRKYLDTNEVLYLAGVGGDTWARELEYHTVASCMLYLAGGFLGPNIYTTMHASYIVPEYFRHNRHRLDDKVSAEEIVACAEKIERQHFDNIATDYGDMSQAGSIPATET